MQQLKQDYPDGFAPDAAWYRAFVAKTLLIRAVQDVVKAAKFPAYQANITAYTAALLAHRCGETLQYEKIWNRQTVSEQFKEMILAWAVAVDGTLRGTAGNKMPTEWAKRPDCWLALQTVSVEIPKSLIPELSV